MKDDEKYPDPITMGRHLAGQIWEALDAFADDGGHPFGSDYIRNLSRSLSELLYPAEKETTHD